MRTPFLWIFFSVSSLLNDGAPLTMNTDEGFGIIRAVFDGFLSAAIAKALSFACERMVQFGRKHFFQWIFWNRGPHAQVFTTKALDRLAGIRRKTGKKSPLNGLALNQGMGMFWRDAGPCFYVDSENGRSNSSPKRMDMPWEEDCGSLRINFEWAEKFGRKGLFIEVLQSRALDGIGLFEGKFQPFSANGNASE